MQEIPDCLNRRYKVLDDLVKELSSASNVDFNDDICGINSNDPGVRLMCDFWKILKENPDCNLRKSVQNQMEVSPKNSVFQPQNVSCYMAAHNCSNKGDDAKKCDPGGKPIKQCCHKIPGQIKPKCCGSKSVSSSQASNDVLPLSKVLCNLNEAASFDRKCQGMINDLMSAQKQLQDQIQHLEHREEEGIQLLKKADCMWSCMEDAYKKKILESQQRQQELINQLKEAEANTNKWRKNKKDLEFQMENINTCSQEINEKLQQKKNDLKCMNRDIDDYKKRIENNKKELDAAKKSVVTKKRASDDKIKKISEDISRREAMIREERAHKEEKENEGNQYIREARADLLNLSKVLLQKKIENEDLRIEKETLIEELEILSQSYDQCKDRCQFKKRSMEDEIKKIDDEITHYKAKCLRCHQCTDTTDIRKFCTDCPRCVEERECLYKEDHCSLDHTMDCVCMSVKQKFLDNIFENMYTVLERQIKTGPGKCVAETVLNCLKKSRNGKLDEQTRQILQDFILTTVKKNLNLTIIGGAVKTRCELDSETYNQLMLCLKQVKAVRPPKADKQTAAKKPPCSRWGGESECNCPKGPKTCICTKRAPPPPNEPGPCPPQDKEDIGEEKICPHKESAACGADCAMHAVPSAVGTDVAAWRPDPCQGPTCMFKNMRAAQCVLGPEALNTTFDSRSFVTAVPNIPSINEDEIPCKCGSTATAPCTCKEVKEHPRERIIEEVMGKYFEVKPIDKVAIEKDYDFIDKKVQNYNEDIYLCVNMKTPLTEQRKSTKTIASQNYNIFYDDIFLMERDKTKCDNVSSYGYKDIILKGISHSFDANKYFRADLKIIEASYPAPTTSVITYQSKEILVKRNLKEVMVHNSNSNTIINHKYTNFKGLNYTLLQEKVVTIAHKLVKDVVVFYYESKQDSPQEWISLEGLVNEILEKPQRKGYDKESEINEIGIKSECLESCKTVHKNVINPLHVDTIYENKNYRGSKNTKQMKVDKRTQCDDKICRTLHSHFAGDKSSGPLVRPQSFQSAQTDNDDNLKVSFTTPNNENDLTEKQEVDNKLKTELIKEQFQPLLVTKSIQNEDTFFESNGKLSKNNAPLSLEPSNQEIDEQVIDLIENIVKQDPSASVKLKKTKSGHLTLDDSARNDDGQSIVIKKSASGNIVIEIEKSSIQNFVIDNCKEELNSDKIKKIKNIDVHNPNTCRPQCSKNKETSLDDITKFLLSNTKEKISVCKQNIQKIPEEGLREMYEKDDRNIVIKFKYQYSNLRNVQATLLATSSEHITIHIKHENVVDDRRVEFPVLLQKTESGTMYIDSDAKKSLCNGVVTRTASNGYLINIKQSISHQYKPLKQGNIEKTQDFFKIIIKGLDSHITEPPAVIKRTPSGNFDVILEKEYEKYFQQTIRHQKIDGDESFFDLTKTSSSFILDFDTYGNERSCVKKGSLIKSSSGLLKIMVSDTMENKSDEKRKLNKYLTFGSKISAKVLVELLRRLPSSFKLQKSNSSKSITKKTKSSSDSQLYETAKMKFHSSQSIFGESRTRLRMTASGQYAIVLDKNLRKSFINKLLSYLDKSSKGIIPINRTDSGEIAISFDKNTGIGKECGSLKITSSGNIYIVLDQSHIKHLSNNVAMNTCHSSKSDISQYISKIDHPENKAISTSCNAHSDDSLCDASQCVCKTLNIERDSSDNSHVDSSTGSYKLCGKIICPEQRGKQCIKSNNKSPHIVIRPSESHSNSDKRNKFLESYYCEVHSVCPYHKDRYESVSNELLEISGLCNKAQEKKILSKVRTYREINQFMPQKNVTCEWNSFDYLPYQLPPFLRNITYS